MTDKIIEAVARAIQNAEATHAVRMPWIEHVARAAIAAYTQAVAGEAVGKQYRYKMPDRWSIWYPSVDYMPHIPGVDVETRDIFAAPPAMRPESAPPAMTDKITEAVARAICLSNETAPDEFDYADNEPMWRRYILDAQYAIAAYTQAVAGEAVGWFNPYNETHGHQQVAKQFEGKEGMIPLFAAPPAQQIPAGYKLVPIEPTDEMFSACEDSSFSKFLARQVYAKMIEAAPEAGQ